MPYVESFDEFTDRQECTPVKTGGRYLYPNGAESDGEWNHSEPPKDKRVRRSLRHEYLKAHLEKLVEEYNGIRSSVSQQLEFFRLGAGPTPERGWQIALARLRNKITKEQEELQDLTESMPRNIQLEAYQRTRSDEREQAYELSRKLNEFPTF